MKMVFLDGAKHSRLKLNSKLIPLRPKEKTKSKGKNGFFDDA
jgi:hypothetical protein